MLLFSIWEAERKHILEQRRQAADTKKKQMQTQATTEAITFFQQRTDAIGKRAAVNRYEIIIAFPSAFVDALLLSTISFFLSLLLLCFLCVCDI